MRAPSAKALKCNIVPHERIAGVVVPESLNFLIVSVFANFGYI
jgi:hypothetical protein